MIKVLVADDSILLRTVLKDVFRTAKDIAVVGEATNGREAVDLTRVLKPDLVIMDIKMPIMDGLTAIEEIMAQFPVPILVLSATPDDREVNYAFAAIKKGALDVMEKPNAGYLDQATGFGARIVEKVRLLSRIKVIHHLHRSTGESEPRLDFTIGRERNILAIGASTGGPRAVMSIIRSLPADFPATVLVVQHIASGFAKGFAKWLDSESSIQVRLADDGDELKMAEVLVAPSDCHMLVEKGRVRFNSDPLVNCCRPSIDVLFNSLADDQGGRVLGVLLTGMGKDGALGLRRIKERGGITLVQDEQSCAVFGMPKAALTMNAVDEVVPLTGMPEAISKIFTGQPQMFGGYNYMNGK